jgi:hypothetical protein
MSIRPYFALGTAAALGIVIGASTMAVAQFNPWNNNNVRMRSITDNWSEPEPLGPLASNEGIYVDVKDFRIAKGTAKGDPATQIAKAGAREAPDGAIVFRFGNKLYIADGKPPAL